MNDTIAILPGCGQKPRSSLRIIRHVLLLCSLGAYTLTAVPVPPPEKLLPDDTLLLMTVPDFGKMRSFYQKSPQTRFWNDPAMRPFRDNFMAHLKDEFVKPLERELDISFDNYTNLLQGQLTLAVVQNGWQGGDENPPGVILLMDSKDKSTQLKKNLSELRKKCADAGKAVRTEKIRDYEFFVLPLSTNDLPSTLRKFFPKPLPVQEAGSDDDTKKPAPKTEFVIGQADSLLIVGNSLKAAEKIVARLSGSSLPALGDSAVYQANQAALFREAPLYGWVNTKTVVDLLIRRASEKKENPDAPNPFDINAEKIFGGLGLSGLKSLAFTFQDSNEGATFQIVLSAPESSRQGILKMFVGEPKETMPPPFVPAEAVKFQRWRLDGQKAWANLEKMVKDINPQWMSGINFLLETASSAAKEKDPDFDIRKSLIGNLGDDMISYERAPRGTSVADIESPPSIFLLGSPNPEQLSGALKNVLGFLAQQAGAPTEREFLGHKIYSVPLPNMPLPGGVASSSTTRTLSYASSGGYVALSTDSSMLEEFLRSSESQAKSLRETAGLTDAAQHVSGQGTSLFGYENQQETMRARFEAFRKNPSMSSSGGLGALSGALGFAAPSQNFSQWLDPSLLPSFDKVSKYFGISVYGFSANVDGLAFKMFFPTPPQLRGSK